MNVHIITVGDEILIGQIVDTNSAWLAEQLNLYGASVGRIISTGDDAGEIWEALDQATAKADLVLMTGGLGPTKDDITKKVLAEYCGDELVFHQPTYDRIVRFFERLGRKANEAHRQQCFLPATATLLHNRLGTAPGMWLEKDGTVIVSMPGIPYEMKQIIANEVLPRIRERFPTRAVAHRTVLTVGEGESNIAARIADFEDALPPNIKLAYLPNLGQVRLRLTGIGADAELISRVLDEKVRELKQRLPDLIFGYEHEQLEEVLGQMLRARGKTLSTAESCTGGYVAHKMTSIAGSSDYFEGGVVTYSNALKHQLLRVKSETLEQYGAVSEAVVREMAQGAVRLLGADIAVAISGIAGPGGGTEEKPVGTIWMAVGNSETVKTQLVRAGKDRLLNIQFASVRALNLVRQFLLEYYPIEERLNVEQ